MTNKSANPFIISKSNPDHGRLIKRQSSESIFKRLGLSSIIVSMVFLAFLLYTIFSAGWQSFLTTKILLNINLEQSYTASKTEDSSKPFPKNVNYRKLIKQSLKSEFPELSGRKNISHLYSIVSRKSYLATKHQLEKDLAANKEIDLNNYKVWVSASSNIDMLMKGNIKKENITKNSKVSLLQVDLVEHLKEEGKIKKVFNIDFLTNGDSREPEVAGLYGSVIGSLFVILVCMLTALPLGVASAIYLEEFAPNNRFTTLIEISVNNLAAIPSIVYGLLGLALYIQFFGLQRSAALVGGLTLALLVLPIIIITTRNSLAAVPPSIKDAARGLGASRLQVLLHHTLPLSLPGIMTGSILSVARALGETAPLLMIGMVAFVKDIPEKITDPSTALPVQIYIWSDLPEKGFAEKTSGAIIILILFLIIANALAVYLRKKFEYKW